MEELKLMEQEVPSQKVRGSEARMMKNNHLYVCMCDPSLDIMALISGDASRILSMFKGGLLEWIINEEVHIK